MDEWRVIDAFPRYEVSDDGVVRNTATDRHLKTTLNQSGVLTVGMMKHGVQFKRSVPRLVAQAFIPRTYPAFDTPINLDGDRANNTVSNLVWRPRWFAVAYNRQFTEAPYESIREPIVELNAVGPVFANSWECAKHFGFLEKDLVLSILNRTYVWPTYQQFGIRP